MHVLKKNSLSLLMIKDRYFPVENQTERLVEIVCGALFQPSRSSIT
jgi:hypothetical protein